MRHWTGAAVLVLLVFAAPRFAYARLRSHYEDATVVERSELIVVGRLRLDSIEYVPHARKGDVGRSWEHHAGLIINEVIKGKSEEKEIPIIIHYGLTPVVGGRAEQDGFVVMNLGKGPDYPADRIDIMDTGNSAVSFEPFAPDAGKDKLWFLRRRSGIYGSEPGTGNLGIVDPEDIQPLHLKDYYQAYLYKDPESALKPIMIRQPEIADRAQHYLDHCAIQRILQIPDPNEKFQKLLPYYLRHYSWNLDPEAKTGVVACGKVAAEALVPLFFDETYRNARHEILFTWMDMNYRDVAPRLIEIFDEKAYAPVRPQIMSYWRRVKYRESVPILLKLLEDGDKFWAVQTVEKGWWNADTDSEQTEMRRRVYGDIYNAVCALEQLRDPRARDALELTLRRWEAMAFENPQIVEACRGALKAITQSR